MSDWSDFLNGTSLTEFPVNTERNLVKNNYPGVLE
jgi:hypothetical protein